MSCLTTSPIERVTLLGNARVFLVTAVKICLDVSIGAAGLLVEVCKPFSSKYTAPLAL